MDAVFALLGEWWPVVALVAAGVAKVLNVLTPHFSERAGVVRALLIVVDVLDMIKVSTAPKGGSK
jgi:hypothetical protein